VESFLEVLAGVGAWSGIVVWALALGACCLVVLLALPGGWVALTLAVIYDAFHGFQAIGPARLIVFAVLLGLGEVVEALLGSVYVAARGATKWGVAGTFLGGIVGAIAGSAVIPVLGTFVGGFAGAFAGAVLLEYLRDRRLEPSFRVGFHATVGRFLAVTVKGVLATAGAAVVAVEAFRRLAAA